MFKSAIHFDNPIINWPATSQLNSDLFNDPIRTRCISNNPIYKIEHNDSAPSMWHDIAFICVILLTVDLVLQILYRANTRFNVHFDIEIDVCVTELMFGFENLFLLEKRVEDVASLVSNNRFDLIPPPVTVWKCSCSSQPFPRTQPFSKETLLKFLAFRFRSIAMQSSWL